MLKLINDEWTFMKTHTGSSLEEVVASNEWIHVDLPHDWLIWQCPELYESADVWYRRFLYYEEIPEICMLHFDGVYMDCDILINGEVAGSHSYGYTAFFVDLTGKIKRGRNEVFVHIRHLSPNSRWYSGSGIYRDVHIIELPADHIVPDSFYLTEEEDGEFWKLRVHAETAGTDRIPFLCKAYNPAGEEIGKAETESAGGHVSVTMQISGAQTWDIDHPVVNKLKYSYGREQGEIPFGLRKIAFSPDNGFFLNHRNIKLKGICLHHDLGALGSSFHKKAARRQLQLMKDMGANAVRTSHNPPASAFLDLCDEMGILVIDEAFDMWERSKTEYDYARFFRDCEENDVSLWIRRDRNHPSVIMWSLGNEIYDMHADLRGTEVCRMLMNQVLTHDPYEHAKVTFGCNYMPWEGGQRCADIVKVAGYNYGEKYYKEHHTNHPDWVIYGSETASVLSSRGIYHFPIEKSIMSESDLQCSALGNSNTSWGATDLKRMLIEDRICEYTLGQFIWSGIDYIGEPTPYKTRSCYFGQADTACFPKDSYYLFQCQWSGKKVLHIGVSWDWNYGQLIDIPVITNYERVELFLNGRSLGQRNVYLDDPQRCLPVWKVPYEPGEITALAMDKSGKTLRKTSKFTPGDTAALKLSTEDKYLCGDGHDLAFVTIQAVDEKGIPVDNARDLVSVSVTGGAYLVGTDNGDSTDPDGYKQNSRRLFGGKLLLILVSDGTAEKVTVTVHSSQGISSELVIPVKKSGFVSGFSHIQRIPDSAINQIIPVRKIEISACGERELSPDCPACKFTWKLLPEQTTEQCLDWQITNDAGIECPFVDLLTDKNTVVVKAHADGRYYLRALGGNVPDHPEIISQIEFSARGFGKPLLDPYHFISAGLYDFHEGKIGAGNEKGIAFARDEISMIGFSSIDFGKAGSDTLILPIFALDGKRYEIELLEAIPENGFRTIAFLPYEKPSIWNVYQEEIYHLPVRFTGIHSLCFRMKEKIHLKGFSFEKQSRAFALLPAGAADAVYGDSYVRQDDKVLNIGNNVSLQFTEMDFSDTRECELMIRGSTALNKVSITVLISNEDGENVREVADFAGEGSKEQLFRMHIPGGLCTVTFVFLPGSHFDFEAFQFIEGS